MERLKRRQDFVAAAKALSQAMPSVVVQLRSHPQEQAPRIGFTCTKKLGNAVVRNHIKRRLREAARLSLTTLVRPNSDYVLIGRVKTSKRPFAELQNDIVSAVKKLHERSDAVGQSAEAKI